MLNHCYSFGDSPQITTLDYKAFSSQVISFDFQQAAKAIRKGIICLILQMWELKLQEGNCFYFQDQLDWYSLPDLCHLVALFRSRLHFLSFLFAFNALDIFPSNISMGIRVNRDAEIRLKQKSHILTCYVQFCTWAHINERLLTCVTIIKIFLFLVNYCSEQNQREYPMIKIHLISFFILFYDSEMMRA